MKVVQRDIAAKQPPAGTGVIDVIADGLSLALARPLLLLVPMLLDLYYWLGWRISVQALTTPIRRWVLDQDASNGVELASQLQQAGRSDASWLFSLLVPSLLSNINRSDVYTVGSRPDLTPGQWWIDILFLIAALLGSALLLMIYAVPLADAALNRSRPLSAVVKAIGTAWLRFLGLVVVSMGIVALLFGPLAVGWVALRIVGVNATPLFSFAAVVLGLVAFLVLWVFAPDAIVVSEIGPLKAIHYSFTVVRAYFWQTIWFTAASLLITVGLGEIWRQIAGTAPGLLIGVIANAFFATGLAMASMLFYASRIQSLKPELTR
jgi:hypothetical protein